MTASEALRNSNTGVISTMLAEGAAAIARSANGFIVSFVPRTDKGLWNLAGIDQIAECETLDAAVEAALSEREVVGDTWRPAPENIIGHEPAVSVAPAFDGHRLRLHGFVPQGADWRLVAAGVCFALAGVLTVSYLFGDREDDLT